MTLMTSELGAGQISTLIAKRRTAYWVSSARVYLEAQNHHISFDSERGSLTSFEFSRPSRVTQPFPSLTSHCGWFGGIHGPCPNNVQKFFGTVRGE